MPLRIDVQAPQHVKDVLRVKADALLAQLRELTPQQVETYFENNLSPLSQDTEAQIEAYIDNISNLADAKAALLVLAKDSAFNSNLLKKLAVAVAFMLRKI